ncbi:hypothetical protein [Sphingosinicella microcystinivorans]|jgi:hypothetical protein|uniref:UrcA family protein n=1 Tax=Sphingosinicella microcystinivorans TaxID=335406 RepID=A0AAD1D3D4_SPHMI|nr:hypothetical protein [Sphingosinicella microcystinivorans]RKS84411.1 hypothetical protein DFR51_3751 [Sphingosinicella microcystinivorans]BBE33053.1 hypothetical protein SmB9_07110 [Sphingosinicella microcystinivorans]
MKMLLFAAAIAAIGFATPSFAQEKSGGHYEWRERQIPGPNKSNISPRVRVWVVDALPEMANCDGDMMKSDAADCMKTMSARQMMPAKG